MLKKRKLIMLGIIIFSATIVYIYSMKKVENSVNQYLTQIKGYDKSEYS